jgi:hypothetical protein
MADFLTGGLNAVEIWKVTDTGSAYTIETGTGNTILLQGNEDIQYNPAEGTMVLNQITDTPELTAFIQANQERGTAVEPTAIRLTDGTEVKTLIAGGDTKLVAAISYGAAKGGKRKVFAVLGRLQNSGSYTEQFNEFTRPTFEIVGVQPAYNLTLTTVLRDTAPTAWVATAATLSIPSTEPSGSVAEWLALPA